MRLALAIASLLILVIHGLVFYDQFFHKWEKFQTAYFDQAKAMAKTDTERAALDGRSPRIEQILVTQFGEMRVDRCTTCHISADDPRFKDYAHPLKSHPFSAAMGDQEINGKWERRHKFSDFGCTVCHDGQGRGLKEYYGHGKDHYWPDPMLGYVAQENWRKEFQPKLVGKEYMEANCAQCHTKENFTATPMITKGRQLFFEKNCYGCHRIEGISNGTLAPDLSEVGKKFKVDYLWESVVDPRANLATSVMPKFNLTDDEVKALVVFLKSRRGINYNETSLERYRARIEEKKPEVAPVATTTGTSPGTAAPSVPPAPEAASALARGEKLIGEKSCVACHKLGDKDGGIAPDLSFEGLLKDGPWLMKHFKNPRAEMPDSIMPGFNLSEADYQAMTDYLLSLKTPPPTATAAETYKNLCARCHGEQGDGKGITWLYLDPAPRDLTKAAFMSSKPDERFIKSIQEGVAGTSMPAWGKMLNETQVRDLVTYIRQSMTKEKPRAMAAHQVPDQNPISMTPDSVKRGEQIYLMRCTGCHGRKADGKGPNSLDIIPRPRNLRNQFFVQSMNDRRLFDSILYGVQGTAMPPWIDYGMTKNDVGDVVNYLRSFNQPKK